MIYNSCVLRKQTNKLWWIQDLFYHRSRQLDPNRQPFLHRTLLSSHAESLCVKHLLLEAHPCTSLPSHRQPKRVSDVDPSILASLPPPECILASESASLHSHCRSSCARSIRKPSLVLCKCTHDDPPPNTLSIRSLSTQCDGEIRTEWTHSCFARSPQVYNKNRTSSYTSQRAFPLRLINP